MDINYKMIISIKFFILTHHISVTDLALLSMADHSILTYGSFGVWGALLAKGGETIMSKELVQTDIGIEISNANLPNWKFIE